MLPFGVTIPATITQRSEIPEGLMNYPVFKVQRRHFLLAIKRRGMKLTTHLL
jgi:hypothetical protein